MVMGLNVLQLTLLAIFAALFTCFLRSFRQEWAILFSLAASVFFALYLCQRVKYAYSVIHELVESFGMNMQHMQAIWKALGVAYICEFAVSVCKETGNHLMAEQISLCGKLAILILGLPVLMTLLSVVMGYEP